MRGRYHKGQIEEAQPDKCGGNLEFIAEAGAKKTRSSVWVARAITLKGTKGKSTGAGGKPVPKKPECPK